MSASALAVLALASSGTTEQKAIEEALAQIPGRLVLHEVVGEEADRAALRHRPGGTVDHPGRIGAPAADAPGDRIDRGMGLDEAWHRGQGMGRREAAIEEGRQGRGQVGREVSGGAYPVGRLTRLRFEVTPGTVP